MRGGGKGGKNILLLQSPLQCPVGTLIFPMWVPMSRQGIDEKLHGVLEDIVTNGELRVCGQWSATGAAFWGGMPLILPPGGDAKTAK